MLNTRAWSVVPVVVLATGALAQPVLILSPVVLNPGATTIVDQSTGTAVPLATAEITVRGTTLTVNGRHRIRSLRVEGVVTHAAGFSVDYSGNGTDIVNGLHLIAEGDILVAGGSTPGRITVTGVGFAVGAGPGHGSWNGNGGCGASGAGYGGAGGASNCLPSPASPGGMPYGTAEAPDQLGSGGGGYGGASSARGGGAVRLEAANIHVDGLIEADGLGNPGTSGAGSGGSIRLQALGMIDGSGRIRADGGDDRATNSSGGGGGGGRIALQGCGISLPETAVAVEGGTALGEHGQPGTIRVFGHAGCCPADFNGDGFLDFFDYDGYVSCFEVGVCPPWKTADFNGDGFADFFDYDAFVAAFERGC